MTQTPFIKIGKRNIGLAYKPLIIPEIGINHNGSLEIAFKMVDAAKKSGAEIIKHQTHIAEDEMAPQAKFIKPGNSNKNIFDIIKNSSLSEEEEYKLFKYVEKKSMIFLSTPFGKGAVDRLIKFKVKAFKIGSGECNNYPLVDYIAKFRKPIILSTGMNSIKSIKPAVKIFKKYKTKYALLHCTNIYPTPPNLVRLFCLKELKNTFKDAVIGLSDHTTSNYTSLGAISLGASIIERHFTDKSSRFGPDISSSMDPKSLQELINGSNIIFQSLKYKGKKKPIKEELKTIKFAYSSVVAIKEIAKGEKLSKNNIWVKRPGTGDFLAKEFKNLIGKKAKKKIKLNHFIKKNNIH